MLRHFSTNLKRSAGCAPVKLVSYDSAPEYADNRKFVGERRQNSLRLLSYNIQVGIRSQSYHHYVTKGWQHILPHSQRAENLDRIVPMLSSFDLVALQEIDGGSIRTGHVNQVQYLAEAAGFPYWYQQLNRNLGKFAQHGNAVLSHLRPLVIEDHKLPGLLPGRGAIFLRFGDPQDPLVFVVLHLSLGQRARKNQLSYIREMVSDYKHIVIMGDLNADVERVLKISPLRDAGLKSPEGVFNTYPSWRPVQNLDHILVSDSLKIRHVEVLRRQVSDHLPIAMQIDLPGQIGLGAH